MILKDKESYSKLTKVDDHLEYILGADVGGSHITAAVVDVQNKTLLRQTLIREYLDTNSSAEEIIESWSNVLQKSISLSGIWVTKISLALPGPFDYEKGICYIQNQGKYDNLYQINVKEKLAEKLILSNDNICLDNDAACFLKGEIFAGKSDEQDTILGLTLGTGLGSVISINGIVEDAELWSSEYKGKIAEDYLSTRWFINRYEELTADKAIDVKYICEVARKEILETIFNEFGSNLKDFLQEKIKLYWPNQIIIGGNIAKASEYFMQKLDGLPVSVRIANLGEESALLGAVSNFVHKTHT